MNITSKHKLLFNTLIITLLIFSPLAFIGASKFIQPNFRMETQVQVENVVYNSFNNLYIEQDDSYVLAESSKFFTDTQGQSRIFGEKLREYLENQHIGSDYFDVLILFEKDYSYTQRLSILNQIDLEYKITRHYKNFPISLIEVLPDDLARSEEKLFQLEGIKKIFLDQSHQVLSHQNNPSSANLVDNENWWLETIGATNLDYDGSGVRIAILDTGIYSDHADFSSVTNINFVTDDGLRNQSAYEDVHGHGTHVAGIAAGTGLSSSGKYQGVAPGASLLNVKTLNDGGGITDSDVIDAVDWLITQDNADIISMSFRLETTEMFNPVSLALESAVQSGIVVVAAAGNEGPEYFTAIPPATNPSVISVGAINRNLEVSYYSSLGPTHMSHTLPDVIAPGTDIIAAESANSLIAYEQRYTNSQIRGSDPNSDYVVLSGTSMSAPMVSGAIALLLEAYPNLTPEGVRAALYQGAYLPNQYSGKYGANGIGAGIINVSASIEWLDFLADPNSILQAYPDRLPYEPLDLLSYPGDSQIFNISLFSSDHNPVSVDITLPISSNIEISSSVDTITFSNHSVEYIEFNIEILENATIGIDFGTIHINNSANGDLLEEIDYAINITHPTGRVYFDSLHGLNDLYPMWPTGFSQIEIYDAMKVLHQNGYQLEYQMENWTMPTQSPLRSQILSPDLLSKMDIIVLQTPVIPYTEFEMDALETFRDNGGSILVLGTRHQMLATTSLNTLLSRLNTDISININNIFEYTDVGFGYVLDKFSVSEIDSSSPIFSPNDTFSYWFGATLETGGNANPIATLNDNTVVASHDSISGGKVVVWSDYHWMRNDVFSNVNAQNHEHILSNLFAYMNTQSDQPYSVGIRFNSTIQSNGDTLQVYLSLTDTITGSPITDRIYGDSLNASLISPTMVKTPLILNSLDNGLYSNTSFTLNSPDYRPYQLQINITSPSGQITKKYTLYRFNDTFKVEIADPVLSSYEITQSLTSSNLIQYTGNTIGLTTNLYGSLTTDSYYSEKPIKEYTFGLTPAGTQYTHTFTVTNQEHGGLVAFFATGISSNNYTNFEVTREIFRILNNEPEIDEANSFFENYPFEDTQTDTSIYILRVNDIGSISLRVHLDEPVNYEDSSDELFVIAHYTAATSAGSYFDPLYPDIIPTSILTYNTDSESFEGSFKIPKKLPFTGTSGSVEVSQESSSDLTYFSVLWITARDTDGGSVDYLFLMNVDIVFGSILEYLPIIIIFLVITGIIVTVLVVSKKRMKNQPPSTYYSNKSTDIQDFVYCTHCGKRISPSYQVCPYCGKFL